MRLPTFREADHGPAAVARTARWLDDVVVGQGMCPFAATPRRLGRVEVAAAPGSTRAVLADLRRLASRMTSAEDPATALLVLDDTFADFADYLDLVAEAEERLEAWTRGALTLASFHPHYQFGGLPTEDIAHWLHRAPHPLLHVLRAVDLERAKRDYPDLAGITQRNSGHAGRLGAAFFARYLLAG